MHKYLQPALGCGEVVPVSSVCGRSQLPGRRRWQHVGTGTEERQPFGGADVRKRLWQGGGGKQTPAAQSPGRLKNSGAGSRLVWTPALFELLQGILQEQNH